MAVNTTTEEITINVINDDEPATIAAYFKRNLVCRKLCCGRIHCFRSMPPILRAVRDAIHSQAPAVITLVSMTNGNITLASALDYETATSYELTVVVDDGTYASTEVITVTVADVNEARSLSATVAFNAFQENTATGPPLHQFSHRS